ncbi:MAG: hypothetical protein WAK54_33390 [Bradyrhizobium sp.]
MSEQQAEQTRGETGSLNPTPSGSRSADADGAPVAVSAPEISVVDSPPIAPDHEAPELDELKAEAPKIEVTRPKAEAPRIEVTKAEAPKVEAPKVEAPKAEATKVEATKVEATKPRRQFAGVAAALALAIVAGALGGALASAGFGHLVGMAEATSPANGALEAAMARIDADMLALKADLEHTSKTGVIQFNKTSDRLDRLEKAQADPAGKLAKLTEAVDKLRAAPAVAPVAAAAASAAPKDVTGSLAPPQAAPASAAAAPKAEVGKLPAVEGWVLTDVGYGGALIENRRGSYEIYAGDSVPGLGRIDAIRRQDGRWVVVTSKGLIKQR